MLNFNVEGYVEVKTIPATLTTNYSQGSYGSYGNAVVQQHAQGVEIPLGWVVIGMFDEEEIHQSSRQEMINGCPQEVRDGLVTQTKAFFVIGRKHDQVMEDLRGQVRLAKEQSANWSKQLEDTFANLKRLDAASEQLTKELKRVSLESESYRTKWVESRDVNHKLEKDISKLRSAIGDIRMKEILEEG